MYQVFDGHDRVLWTIHLYFFGFICATEEIFSMIILQKSSNIDQNEVGFDKLKTMPKSFWNYKPDSSASMAAYSSMGNLLQSWLNMI